MFYIFSLSVPRIVLHAPYLRSQSGGQECMKGAQVVKKMTLNQSWGRRQEILLRLHASGCDIRSMMNTLQLWSQSPYPSVASQEEIVASAIDNVEDEFNTQSSGTKKTRRGKKKKKAVPVSKRKSKRKAAAVVASVTEALPDQMIKIASLSGVTMPTQTNPMNKHCTDLVSRWSGRCGISDIDIDSDTPNSVGKTIW